MLSTLMTPKVAISDIRWKKKVDFFGREYKEFREFRELAEFGLTLYSLNSLNSLISKFD